MKLSLFLFSAFCTYLLSLSAISQPKLTVVGGTSFEFGELHSDEPVKKIVTIRNDGDDTLEVSSVSASCGCTGALLSSDRIAPGDSGQISISFNPDRFSGNVKKYISFETNDPINSHARVNFSATINRILAVEPDYLMFKDVKLGEPSTMELTVKNLSKSPITITSIIPSDLAIAIAQKSASIPAESETTLSFTLTSPAAGTVRGNIELKTDNTSVPVKSIRYFAFVKDPASKAAVKE